MVVSCCLLCKEEDTFYLTYFCVLKLIVIAAEILYMLLWPTDLNCEQRNIFLPTTAVSIYITCVDGVSICVINVDVLVYDGVFLMDSLVN